MSEIRPLTALTLVSMALAVAPMAGRAAAGAPPKATEILVESIDHPTQVDAFSAREGTKAVVFLFTSTDCPISNRYAPEVRRLSEKYRPLGVVFRLIYPGRGDSAAAIHEHITTFGYAGAADAFRDAKLALAHFVGATVTPEAAVVVGRTVVYHGRIDDRYADLGVERPSPTTHDLEDAIEAVLAGRPVAHPATRAFGCYISDLAR